MSRVSPEESPVFNCSSLLTTPREQDSECARLGPSWEVGREGAVWGDGGGRDGERLDQGRETVFYWQVPLEF